MKSALGRKLENAAAGTRKLWKTRFNFDLILAHIDPRSTPTFFPILLRLLLLSHFIIFPHHSINKHRLLFDERGAAEEEGGKCTNTNGKSVEKLIFSQLNLIFKQKLNCFKNLSLFKYNELKSISQKKYV